MICMEFTIQICCLLLIKKFEKQNVISRLWKSMKESVCTLYTRTKGTLGYYQELLVTVLMFYITVFLIYF